MRNWTIYSSDTILNFGKYKGETLEGIAKTNSHYILWCVKNIDKFLISKELLLEYQNKYPCLIGGNVVNTKEYIEFDMNEFQVTDKDLDLLESKWNAYENYLEINNSVDDDYYKDYSVSNNPYYNDNLDLDQQDPEFWDSF